MNSESKKKIAVFWFRRDLRLHDNAGLYYALRSDYPVLPLFIFDRNILDKLENKEDKRIVFIYNAIQEIQKELKKYNSDILVEYDFPANVWKKLLTKYDIAEVYTNTDYEPYATDRDHEIADLLNKGRNLFQVL